VRRRAIQEAVSSCDVLLVLIGPAWEARGGALGSRLNEPTDYVRIEIETAIQRDIPIMPLLVDDRRLPGPQDLPESLQPLLFRNGMRMRPDPDFRQDMKRLTDAIRRSEKAVPPTPVAEEGAPIIRAVAQAREATTPSTTNDQDTPEGREPRPDGPLIGATVSEKAPSSSVVANLRPTAPVSASKVLSWFRRILPVPRWLLNHLIWISFLILIVCAPVSCGIPVLADRRGVYANVWPDPFLYFSIAFFLVHPAEARGRLKEGGRSPTPPKIISTMPWISC
jgi:hypothetical protein